MPPETSQLGSATTAESYERVPVEEFGVKMLKSMGWKEDAKNEFPEPIEYIPRQHRLGFGAKPLTSEQVDNLYGYD